MKLTQVAKVTPRRKGFMEWVATSPKALKITIIVGLIVPVIVSAFFLVFGIIEGNVSGSILMGLFFVLSSLGLYSRRAVFYSDMNWNIKEMTGGVLGGVKSSKLR